MGYDPDNSVVGSVEYVRQKDDNDKYFHTCEPYLIASGDWLSPDNFVKYSEPHENTRIFSIQTNKLNGHIEKNETTIY